MVAPLSSDPDEPKAMSAQEHKILASIEDHLCPTEATRLRHCGHPLRQFIDAVTSHADSTAAQAAQNRT